MNEILLYAPLIGTLLIVVVAGFTIGVLATVAFFAAWPK